MEGWGRSGHGSRGRVPWRFGSLLDPWVVSTCAGCRRAGPSPCRSCLGRLRAAPPAPPVPGLDAIASLVRYDEASRPFVLALKQYGDLRAVGDLLDGCVDLAIDLLTELDGRPDAGGAVLLTWAPTTSRRRRHRGHDQARILARAVGARCGVEVREMLRRPAGPSQEGRTAGDRRAGITFVPTGRAAVASGTTVVVIDDVTTTGATLVAAASALRSVGVVAVGGLTLACTPSPLADRG